VARPRSPEPTTSGVSTSDAPGLPLYLDGALSSSDLRSTPLAPSECSSEEPLFSAMPEVAMSIAPPLPEAPLAGPPAPAADRPHSVPPPPRRPDPRRATETPTAPADRPDSPESRARASSGFPVETQATTGPTPPGVPAVPANAPPAAAPATPATTPADTAASPTGEPRPAAAGAAPGRAGPARAGAAGGLEPSDTPAGPARPARAAGGHGAGGRGSATHGADRDVDPSSDIPIDATDADAIALLTGEWDSAPIPRLLLAPIEAEFTAPSSATFVIPPKPAPPGDKTPAEKTAAANTDAVRRAGDAYALLASQAREYHSAVLAHANAEQVRLRDQAEQALRQADRALVPHVEQLRQTLEQQRQILDRAAEEADATIDQQATLARRSIWGAAAAARRRIALAVAGAQAQLPSIGTSLRQRFINSYSIASGEIRLAGTFASTQLRSPAKHTATANAIPEGTDPTIRAQVEAKRRAVPRELNSLATTIATQAPAQARNIDNRLTTAPPGGASLSANIDVFIESLRQNIVGGTTAAGTTESLGQRGNRAVDGAQTQALRSLADQVKAVKRTVRHARASGEHQLALQRSAGLARLSDIRRSALQSIGAQAASALGTIASATRSALPLYADAVRRTATTLQSTAASGAAALAKAAQTATVPVARSLSDGRQVQFARLTQVANGAAGSSTQQSEQVQLDGERANGEFTVNMGQLVEGLVTELQQTAEQQSSAFRTLARGVASSATSFTQPIPTMYAAAIANQVRALDPVFTSEDATVSAEAIRIVGEYNGKSQTPLDHIGDALFTVAKNVDGILCQRAVNAWSAIDRFDMDEDALMAAFRGLSQRQAEAVEFKYNAYHPNLRNYLREQHDALATGLNDNEYNSIISALNGDAAAAARYELATTTHWYGNEGERASQVIESLSEADRRTLVTSPEWANLRREISSGLHGTEAGVFDALADPTKTSIQAGARVGALRTRDRIDAARRARDDEALARAVTELGAPASADRATLNPDEVRPTDAEYRTAVQREFATLPGVMENPPPAGTTLTPEQAANTLANYATRTFTVEEPVGEGQTMPVTYRLENTSSILVGAIARSGPDSVDARAARLLHESERPGGGRPNLEALENALVDPRLNPALTPDLTPEQRDAARQEQDQIYLRYAELADANHVPGAPHNALEARMLAEERLRLRFGDSARDRVGADYTASIVREDRPNPVFAMRYAVEGSGTDEALIHRTLGRLSREDIARLRTDYNARYGEDLYARLGVFGRGSFGEVSGDDRLQVERELMGVPRNDRERLEVAMFANQQQVNERGILNVNGGSAEERALTDARAGLRSMAGSGTVTLDEFGRPTISGGSFDARGRYTGPDRDAFGRSLNFSQAAVDAYTARIDRIASVVTTGIAILGAVVAAAITIATAGAAGPLIVAALATGLASMAANAAIRGGRYGWEEAAVDLGMTAVQAITAGVGAQLGAASQAAIKGAQAAGATAATITRMSIVNAARIGAVTGAIGGVGGAALNESTWDRGIGSGLGLVLAGGLKGALSGAVTGAVTNGIEGIGRGDNTIGNAIGGLSARGGLVRGGLNIVGRGLGRSAISGVGGMTGRTTELLFDTATGQFHGSRREAFASIGEAGTQAAFQGFFEGAAEAGGQRYHDSRHPPGGTEPAPRRPAGETTEPSGAPSRQSPDTASIPPPSSVEPVTVAHPIASAEAPAPTHAPEAGPPRGPAETPDARPRTSPGTAEDGAARRPAVHEAGEGTASAIRDSDFHGRAVEPGSADAASGRVAKGAVRRLLGVETGGIEGARLPNPRDATRIALLTHSGEEVPVRVRVTREPLPAGPDGAPVARFRPDPQTGGYIVEVSGGAQAHHVERALAHELAEIRAGHGRTETADVLTPSRAAPESAPGSARPRLSPHDEGRLAELGVIARDLRNARSPSERSRLLADAQALVEHLGLLGSDPASARRRDLVFESLGGSPRRGMFPEVAATSPENARLLELAHFTPDGDARGLLANAVLRNSPEANRLLEIGEMARRSGRSGLVDNDMLDLPGAPEMGMRRDDPRPGRGKLGETRRDRQRIEGDLRDQARRDFGRMLQEAILDPGQHNPLTQRTLEYLTPREIEYVVRTGRLPRGIEFHHLLAVADFPEFAGRGDVGLGLPKDVHRSAGHDDLTSRPVEAGTLVNPGAENRPPFHNDPEAVKGSRARRSDIAEGSRSTGDVDRDLGIQLQAQQRQLTNQAERLEGEIARMEARLAERRQEGRATDRIEATLADRRADLNRTRRHLAELPAAGAALTAARTAPTTANDGTAAGVRGSDFVGNATNAGIRAYSTQLDSAIPRLAETGGPLAGSIRQPDPENPHNIRLRSRSGDEVTVEVSVSRSVHPAEADGLAPAARIIKLGEGHYAVEISAGTPARHLERALAHELVEIRARHGQTELGDALRPGGRPVTATEDRRPNLSAHDEGRLAELGVMARQLAETTDPAVRAQLRDDAERLVHALGLTGDSDAAVARRNLALAALRHVEDGPHGLRIPPEAADLVLSAVGGAGLNPFLIRPTGQAGDDLKTLQAAFARLANEPATATNANHLRELARLAAQTMIDAGVVHRTRGGTGTELGILADRLGISRGEFHRSTDPFHLFLRTRGSVHASNGLADGSMRPSSSKAITPGFEADYRVGPHHEELAAPTSADFHADAHEYEGLSRESANLRSERDRPTTSASRRDEINHRLDEIGERIIPLSERIGLAAGKRFVEQCIDPRPTTETPMRRGAGVPDLMYEGPEGRIVIVECKGGESPLGSRASADRRFQVEQGTIEYLQSLARTMANSKSPTREAGERLLAALAHTPPKVEYYSVRQPFDDHGRPTAPEVAQFDLTPNHPLR